MNTDILARIAYHQAEIEAVNAEIEGMKAENMQRMHRNESMAYPNEYFVEKANEIHDHAAQLRLIGYNR